MSPQQLAEAIIAERTQGRSVQVVCGFEHEPTEMVHFDGQDAVKIVAESLGVKHVARPIELSQPYGRLAIRREALNELQTGKFRVLYVDSIEKLKAVQLLVDDALSKPRGGIATSIDHGAGDNSHIDSAKPTQVPEGIDIDAIERELTRPIPKSRPVHRDAPSL